VDAVFGILGPTALRVDGEWDEGWGPPRERATLAALLINAGKAVSLDTLVEWVHEDETSLRDPAATFHTYAWRIRQRLQRAGIDGPLIVHGRTFRLGIDPLLVDIHLFRALMADVRDLRRACRPALALDRVRQAVSLRRGRPADDLHTDRADVWRHRVLVNDWLPANTILLELLLELGQHATALSQVDDLFDEHPTDLGLAKARMAALHGLGRGAEATVYYLNVYRRLRAESDFHGADHIRQFHQTLDGAPAVAEDSSDPPRHLPHDIEFVGRLDLLHALDRATATPAGKVVIIDGMAGVGKTSLAVRWGHLARTRFPDGDFFVDLQGYSSDAPVIQSRVVDDLLIALGHVLDKRVDQRSREQLLKGRLAGKRALVLLDNASDTAHVKDLIGLMPSCVVLVTSRDRLSPLSTTTGAHRVHVEPMPDDEAADLLSKRLGPHRDIERADRAQVVRQCGGLPLVIALVAEHIAASGIARVSAFVNWLDRRKLLLGIDEDLDSAGMTHTVLSWSYRRLAPAGRRLFRLLGLHPGADLGIELAYACDGRTPKETRQTLGALVSGHLLERLDPLGHRHRFHDLFKEFAAITAEREDPPDELRATERRILSYYLDAARRADRLLYPYRTTLSELPLEPRVEPRTFESAEAAQLWFDQEHANLVAAVAFASSRGHHDFTPALADATTAYLERHGRTADSRTVCELAVASAHATGDRNAEISALEALSKILLLLGDHAQARRCVTTALRHAVDDDNERAQAACLHLLGRLSSQRGDPAAAVKLYQRCIDLAQRIDDQLGQCWSHCRMGDALRALDQHDDALRHLFRSLSLAEQLNEKGAQSSALATIASIYRDKGDPHAAKAHATEALSVAEGIPDLRAVARVCIELAEITAGCGNSLAAVRHAQHAVTMCQQTNNVAQEARAREVHGTVLLAAGDPTNAALAWHHAAEIYDRTGNPARAVLVRSRLEKLRAGDVTLPAARSNSPSLNPPPTTKDRSS
jgi:tetratricopeptide (TPR) repeat protein/DNA-binding SARP family transcriptional activator